MLVMPVVVMVIVVAIAVMPFTVGGADVAIVVTGEKEAPGECHRHCQGRRSDQRHVKRGSFHIYLC